MSSDGIIRILTLANERYAMPLAVLGRSLLENHTSGRRLLLRVVDGGLAPSTRLRLDRSWQNASPSPATWEFVPPCYGAANRLPVWGHIPALTYTRLFLNEHFPECRGRAVVLDSDILVLADLAALHDVELDGHALGACVDPFIPTVSAIDGLTPAATQDIPKHASYFNAGVMVADLGTWDRRQICRRALAYIDRHRRELRQYEQDALNYAAFGHWKALDVCWNTHPRTPNALGHKLPDKPRIIHFSGRLKPWLYDGQSPFDRHYLDILRRTEWRDFRVPGSWKAIALRLYDSPVRRVFHGLEKRVLAARRSLVLRWQSR